MLWLVFFHCRSQTVPGAQRFPDHMSKEDLRGVKSAAKSSNLQWTGIPGGEKVYQEANEESIHPS